MSVFNFLLNQCMPYVIIAFVSFYQMGWDTFEPYVILAASVFIGSFHFKAGYAVAYCECKGIDLEEE
ncbi:MAG: hypothetical protein VB980_04950 [Opitutales bacterium]